MYKTISYKDSLFLKSYDWPDPSNTSFDETYRQIDVHYNHDFDDLLPRVRQLVEVPQKNGNMESGRNEKLELIFLIGTSPIGSESRWH